MDGLLSGDIDAAEAMIYNEYAQVLEAENPETGEALPADDLSVISYEEIGVGMLQDAIWADGERLANDEAYRDIAVRLAASLQGWAYCRDNVQECTDLVVEQGSQLGASHQLWQMNEISQLIWPADQGVGVHRPGGLGSHRQIAEQTPNLEGRPSSTPPDAEAFTNDLVTEAHANLEARRSTSPARTTSRSRSRSSRAAPEPVGSTESVGAGGPRSGRPLCLALRDAAR